jgi:hypothetical protein
MYFLFRYKGWEPSEYFNMPYGEKKITRVFALKEAKERTEEFDKLNATV